MDVRIFLGKEERTGPTPGDANKHFFANNLKKFPRKKEIVIEQTVEI